MFIRDDKKSGPLENPPQGTQCARLIHIIDLGTQETEFQGQKKQRRQVRLTWELVDAKMKDGRNFVIGKTFNASLYKSGLLDTIESMTGKPIEFESDGSYNMNNLINHPCMVTVVYSEKNGNTYANIGSVSPLPTIKGKVVDCDEATNHLISFSLENFDQDTYDMIPKWIREKLIEKSPEFKNIKSDDLPF